MDMFVTKQSQVSFDNPTPDQGQATDNNVDIDPNPIDHLEIMLKLRKLSLTT
jgi:hypothetical protein